MDTDPLTNSPLPPIGRKFLRYARVYTTSDPTSDSTPSTSCQLVLGEMLRDELLAIGAQDVEMDEHGYVFATIPAAGSAPGAPTVGLLAHMDTSPEAPGKDVRPVVHFAYDGSPITLPGDPDIVLDPATQPALLRHLGHDVITSDGTTLLGSDDKAGIAILMQLAADLLADRHARRPTLRLCFTVDEEIGRGVEMLDLEKLGVSVAYTIDGSGTDCIYAETFNAAEATITVDGVNVHPGYAKDIMVNASRILVSLLSELPEEQAPETTQDREGYLHLQSLSESTPARAQATILLRDFSQEGLARLKQRIRETASRHAASHPRARISVAVRDQYRNMRSFIEESDRRVLDFAYRAAESMGMQLTCRVVRGGTDGARLSELGIPTPNIFNGGYDIHSRFEWNTVQNLERSLVFVKVLLAYWATNGVASTEEGVS